MRYLCLLVLIFVFSGLRSTNAQTLPIQWQTVIGTSGGDELGFAIRATDGGYLAGGRYGTVYPDGDMNYTDKGQGDFWIVKLDWYGNKVWDKGYGGLKDDVVACAIATSDGGYLLGGASGSGKYGDKTEGARGAYSDYWLIKIDVNGNKQWDKTLGGEMEEYCASMIETTDGGFIIGGTGMSNQQGDVTATPVGAQDFWVVKLDRNGNKIWDRIYGGKNTDKLMQLTGTSDGGFIMAGSSSSVISSSKTEKPKGLDDYWIVKADTGGKKEWDRTIGTTKYDIATCVTEAYNGGFLVAGIGGDTINGDKTQAGTGMWVIRLDAKGNKKWEKMFVDEKGYAPSSIMRSGDGGYLLAGTARNKESVLDTVKGGNDYLLMRLDTAGNKSWAKTIGGSLNDTCIGVIETEDGYVLSGTSGSPDGADKKGHKYGPGNRNFWMVKLSKFPLAVSPAIDNKHTIARVAGMNGSLQIELVGEGAAQYLVYDISGRKVSEGILLSGQRTINTLPGIYNIYMKQHEHQQMVRAVVY